MRSAIHLALTATLAFPLVSYAQTSSTQPQPTSTRPQTPGVSDAPSTTTTTTPSTTAPKSTAPSTATPSSPAPKPTTPSAPAPTSTAPSPTASSTTTPAATASSTNNGPTSDSTGTKEKDPSLDRKEKAPKDNVATKSDAIPSPGEALDPHIKKGSQDDVDAVGTRDIGGRGIGNWYSTDWEIRNGKMYSMEIEKSAHMVSDPVVNEYVNRVGQNIVKNSDCKVPFTIKVIDSDEINAMALPGGFFYVNSGLILAADEEAELGGVMAHEIAHVCAHHAARQMTKMNMAQIGSIPLIIFTSGTWTGYGIYEAMQLALPIGFLKFSRMDEAQADWLGLQYMYKTGYDPQAFIQFFEKIDALEKHKPGTLAKVFSDHPQTPDRIARSEEEIATIMPARPDYIVSTSEFDDVKARLARIENKRKLNDKGKDGKPTLRRVGGGNNDPSSPSTNPSDSGDNRPTLSRRD
jgi:beta-barrel assembly-enhancing protease